MTLVRAFKTELDPNNRQRTVLLQHTGTARFVFNWGLDRKIEARENGEAYPTYVDLSRGLNLLKKTEFHWMYDVSSKCVLNALVNLDQAFKDFFRRCNKKSKGKTGMWLCA